MLRNGMGVGAYGSAHISITEVYGPKLFASQGDGGKGCPISIKKSIS